MYTRTMAVQLPDGLHLKDAGDFTQLAGKYKSDISVEIGSGRADAKSLLSLLSLGVFKEATITISAEGPDEREAVEALAHQAGGNS